MKPALTFLALACSLALAPVVVSAEEAPITPAAPLELFNGKDFTGWSFKMKGDVDPLKIWSVENGIIKCTGKPNGYMRTDQTYRDYHLTVEWRFTKAGNTGVLVHMGLPDKVWPRCFECQGMHNRQGDFWLWGGADCKEPKIPGKNGIAMPETSAEKPVGEWNLYEVDCAGDTIKIIVNGKLMNTATGCNETSGRIGIQSEGGEIEVRKITIAPLKK